MLTFVESGLGPDKIRPSLVVAAVAASGRRVRLVVVLSAHNSSSFDCFPLLLFILAALLCVWLENEITVVLFGRALKTGTTWPLFCFVLLLFQDVNGFCICC